MAEKSMIRRMEIELGENGGHTVTHHMKEKPSHSSKHGMNMGYQEPKPYPFGANEGHEMLAHIANHLGIKEMESQENEDEQGED